MGCSAGTGVSARKAPLRPPSPPGNTPPPSPTHLLQQPRHAPQRRALDSRQRLGRGGQQVGQHALEARVVVAVRGRVAEQRHDARLVLLQPRPPQQRAQQRHTGGR